MKDNFSKQSSAYAQFRPGYPAAFFDFLFQHCHQFEYAWDCATGNGQIAMQLAERFEHVEATDISDNQLLHAIPHARVRYTNQPAEAPLFGEVIFDLIVVGQAAHWFSLERFYTQVRRVIKPGGLLVLVGYYLPRFNDPAIDGLVNHLYTSVLGPYWDVERRWVDQQYATLPFPFEEIPFPKMSMEYTWTSDQLIGYLSTWSAAQHFIQKNGSTPIDQSFLEALNVAWPAGTLRQVTFPIFGRAGV
jgi:ubiquinone/menaquinone biosynthesis C-methylase UbiE